MKLLEARDKNDNVLETCDERCYDEDKGKLRRKCLCRGTNCRAGLLFAIVNVRALHEILVTEWRNKNGKKGELATVRMIGIRHNKLDMVKI